MKWDDKFISYLRNERQYSENTLRSYRTDLDQFSFFLKVHLDLTDWAAVRHAHVRSWLVELVQAGCTSKTIHRKISTLKSFYKYMKKTGGIRINPMSGVTSPKIGKRLPVFVREDVMDSSRDSPVLDETETFAILRDRLIIEILYNTGMRRAELINLKETDIQADRLELRVLGKGNKERVIPVTRPLMDEINRYIKVKHEAFTQNDSHLIVTDRGVKAYPKFIYNKVRKWLSLFTTLDKKSPHILRHTFATHLANNGADLNAIKEILGHANLAATEIYTHNTVDKLKSIYKKAHPRA